jgi:hypothetical protein
MTTPLEMLRWERRRKLQVREAFRSGLAHFASHPGDPLAFYSACAAYLVPAQRRLIDQDMRLAELLKPRVPASESADHQGIESLKGRLRQSDEALARFEAATRQLATKGAAARKAFEDAAHAYIDFVVNVLGAKSHSLRHLTTTLFSADDWGHIAGLTEAVIAEEGQLFQAVRATAPAGCDPEAVSTDRGRPA